MISTKKQKTNVSNAIVATLSSMDPPGRFLKQCAETGEWIELSTTDAADRVAQAMAYAVRGKETFKRRREQLRRSRSSLRQKSKGDAEGKKSSQRADRPPRPKNFTTNNHLGGDISSSAAQWLTTRMGVAAGASNGNPSALEQLCVPRNSHLQQQILRQHLPHQSSTTSATLPTTLGSYVGQNVTQNDLVQLLLQSQQQLPQQLPPQYTVTQNLLGQSLQSQTSFQPALQIEGLMPTLTRAQQQQQLLTQQLLNQQNVPTTSLHPSILASLITGNRSQLPSSYPLQPLQQQSNPLNDFLLSRVLGDLQQQPNSNTRTSNAPQEAHANQLLRSLMLQQNQSPASTLAASSLNNLVSPQQQLDCLLQQTLGTLPLQQQNSQVLPPPSNFGVLASSPNVAAQSSDQERTTEDEVQIGSEEDSAGD